MLLTSNNTRELTEALKRRCLYLWLDYPDAERELEIVALHVPDLPETITRRLIEIIHMVRGLDLKKPPSIAESIDWARALLLLGATDIDQAVFERTMSIIVKHRTDLDVVAERVGVRLDDGILGKAERALARPRRASTAGLPEARRRRGSPRSSLRFCDELREEGVKVGTAEILDAFGALGEVSWTEREDFRETLAATLAKSQEDRRVFELLFDRFFFRAVEAEAIEKGLKETALRGRRADRPRRPEGSRSRTAIRAGNDGEMADLARLAVAAFGGQGESSGVIGVDVQRIRRTLDLRQQSSERRAGRGALDRENLRRFEAHLRRELERALIQRTESLPPAQAAGRARPRAAGRPAPGPRPGAPRGGPAEAPAGDLGPRGARAAGAARSSTCAARCARRSRPAACRCGCRYRPKRPRRPEIYVLCDVSTSVTSASVFFLSVLHALHDAFRKLRSFAFVERIDEVTEIFERERTFRAVSQRIAREAGVSDVSGYTDYGRVWLEFLAGSATTSTPARP